MATQQPDSASRYYAASAEVARRATRQARQARPRGALAVVSVVAAHQAAQAALGERAVDTMLAEQRIDAATEALLDSAAFMTDVAVMTAMLEQVRTDYEFDRLVGSLVQDAGRAAESVAITARPRLAWVRHLNLPSCSRCAVLAGRVYRYSEGFKRHPGCDCVMVPTTVGSNMAYDLDELVRTGQVTGLSAADRRAISQGADLGLVVNVRRASAGLTESGRVLARRDRLTPEGIYRRTGNNRAAALDLLRSNGYLR